MKTKTIWKSMRPDVHFTHAQITTLALSTIFLGVLAALTAVILIPVEREYALGADITHRNYIPDKPPPP